MKHNRIVVVLGMHRSGTSAITRGLEVLGVDLGGELIPGIEDQNKKGFYEDRDVNRLNHELLLSLGHDWNSSAPLSEQELTESPVSRQHLQRAVELLQFKLRGDNCFGIKDPRIARLLPFWQNVFELAKCRVSYIIAYRNPLNVALSLSKRDGMAMEKALYLWFEHMLRSLTLTRGARRVVVDYDRIMKDPSGQLKRIAVGLDLSFNPGAPALSDYREHFLEERLQHHHFEKSDLVLDRAANSFIIKLDDLISDMAGDVKSIDSEEVESFLSRANCQLQDDLPKLNYIKSIESDLVKAYREVSGREKYIAELNAQLAARDATILNISNRIESIEASFSWRITRPLRELVTWYNKLIKYILNIILYVLYSRKKNGK